MHNIFEKIKKKRHTTNRKAFITFKKNYLKFVISI